MSREAEKDNVYAGWARILANMESVASGAPEDFDVNEFNRIYMLALGGMNKPPEIATDFAERIRNREVSEEEVQDFVLATMQSNLDMKSKIDPMQVVMSALKNGLRVTDVCIQGMDTPPHINAQFEAEDNGYRLDCLTCPEFYVRVQIRPELRVVGGRFSEDWFPGGSVARPQASWVDDKHRGLRVTSPGGEFSCVLQSKIVV
jgi:hypothetical protein